jgi:heat-inducible transcriptional repressor
VTEELSQRAQTILAAVVSGYVTTAEPVGSRTISKLPHIDLSPATIRNVMADLEEMGYLTQPHVSAGRIPTARGLRFYVDSILKVRELDEELKQRIRRALTPPPDHADLGEILKSASQALSELSQNVAVVAAPNPEHEVFRHMEFILLEPGVILVVFVAKSGGVQNRVITAEPEITQEDLDKYTRYLNELLCDLTLSEVKERVAREMSREKVRFDAVLSRALALGNRALQQAEAGGGEVYVEGQANLLDLPEFQDISRLRRIFRAFEEKSTILRLLEKAMMAQGLQIFLGAESQIEELEDLGAVTAAYGDSERPLGALGVIGPTRMDYSKVIPIVDYTARMVSRILEERS